jgi:hypothetical protein
MSLPGYGNERSPGAAPHRIRKASLVNTGFDLEQYDDDERSGFGNGQPDRADVCISQRQINLQSPLSKTTYKPSRAVMKSRNYAEMVVAGFWGSR